MPKKTEKRPSEGSFQHYPSYNNSPHIQKILVKERIESHACWDEWIFPKGQAHLEVEDMGSDVHLTWGASCKAGDTNYLIEEEE